MSNKKQLFKTEVFTHFNFLHGSLLFTWVVTATCNIEILSKKDIGCIGVHVCVYMWYVCVCIRGIATIYGFVKGPMRNLILNYLSISF